MIPYINKHCAYYENGVKIENDTIRSTQIEEWFIDSYKHHTDTLPSNDMIKAFKNKEYILNNSLGVEMVWYNY